jgi:hypothetical protein
MLLTFQAVRQQLGLLYLRQAAVRIRHWLSTKTVQVQLLKGGLDIGLRLALKP